MKGAHEYANLFKTGVYGRLYIESTSHARGRTFHIYVIPKDTKKFTGGIDSSMVEVYGVISGNPGWTEEYGWLHQGKWVQDFEVLVKDLKDKILIDELRLKKQIAYPILVQMKRL